MLDLGTARGAITLDADGFLSGVGIVKSGVEDLGGIGETAGRGLASLSDRIDNVIDSMGRFSGVARVIDGVSRALGALAITGGVTLIAGGARAAWDQVRAVQNATSALRAYERDATLVDRVLKGLLDYARSDLGVLFSRQELFAAAQGLKLYGAETNNLVRYVEIMSRSVGLGLSNWDQLGTVIGRVGSTGRLVGQDFDYLTAAGFRLDEGLRNANLTWDQLFEALDRGIPANALEGIAKNIDGLVIRVRSAIRDIGNAFLGVDRDTSQFMEGSLGEWLVKGLEDAPGIIRSATDAAADLGNIVASTIGLISDFIAGYRGLPGPIREAVEWILKLAAAYGALRVASSAFGMVGNLMGIGGLIRNVRELSGGFAAASGGSTSLAGSLRMLVPAINPAGLAVAGVTLAVGAGIIAWGKYRQRVEENAAAIRDLEQAWRETEQWIAALPSNTANRVQSEIEAVQAAIGSFTSSAEEYRLALNDLFTFVDEGTPERVSAQITELLDSSVGQTFMAWIGRNKEVFGDEFEGIYQAMLNREHLDMYADDIINAFNQFLDDIIMQPSQRAELENAMRDFWRAALDPGVDFDAVIEQYNSIFDQFTRTQDVDAFIASLGDLVTQIEAGEFALEDLEDQLTQVFATAEEVREVFSGLPRMIDDLKIDGLDQAANDLERVGRALEATFLPQYVPEEGFGLGAPIAEMNRMIDSLDPAKLPMVAESFNQISSALSSGDFDNAMLLADVFAIIDDTGLTLDQKADALREVTDNMSRYVDVTKVAAEHMQRLMEVAGLDDPLSRWSLAGNATDMSRLAMNTQQASTALDSAFRVVVGNTNAFASQAQGVEDWISGLATAEEGLTKLQELQESGLITQTEYNAAMQAHADILESNARLQENVLAIQAQQAPIIADQTEALADYIEHIASLPAHQQRAALGWMDAATAGQAFELQSLAIAAATGQMGDAGMDMAGTMIASLALVDPYLAAVLEDMGLISMGADGTITIHWSGLQEGMSDFDRLSVMFLEFMNLVSDEPITFEMLGLDDPREKLQDIEDTTIRLNDSPVNIPVAVEDTDLGPGVDAIVAGIRDNISPIVIPVEIQTPSSAASAGQSAGQAAAGAIGSVMADVTFTVSADTSAADSRLEEVNGALDTLRTSETSVTINADANQADAELDNLQVRLFGFTGDPWTITITADTSAAADPLNEVIRVHNDLSQNPAIVMVDADTSSAHTVLSLLDERLTGFQNLISTTTLEADDTQADNVLDLLAQRLTGYRDLVSTTTLDADSSSAHEVIRLLENRLNEVDGSQAVVYLHAIDFATSTINSVSRELSNLNGRSSTVYVDTVARGGGIVGRAGGGIVREPVTLVGEDGPELVALPYGSEVFSNSATMRMLREVSSRAPDPIVSPQHSSSRTTVIDRSTHTTEYIALTESDFQRLLAESERGAAVHAQQVSPRSYKQYGRRR